MGYSINISRDRSLVITNYHGHLTVSDIADAAFKIRYTPGFKSQFNEIMDLSDVRDIRIPPGIIAEVAGMSPFGRGSRRAIVAPTDLGFGIGHQYKIFQNQYGPVCKVFRDSTAAWHWLENELAA